MLLAPAPSSDAGGGERANTLEAPGAEYADMCAPRPELAGAALAASPHDAEATGDDAWSGRVKKPRTKDVCEPADTNLAAAEKQILAGAAGPAAPRRTWDRASAPQYMGLVDARLHLAPAERALLQKNGFVVLASHPVSAYATAYHDVFQMELPVFVSADSILHSVYAANDTIIATVEAEVVAPALDDALAAMSCALPALAKAWPVETARDADLYLAVARALLRDQDAPPTLFSASQETAMGLVARAKAGEALEEVELFGRARMVDFTQYTPRGHYAIAGYSPFTNLSNPRTGEGIGSMASYFRAAMWLSRLELNLVSRGCRSSGPGMTCDSRETPREALLALALGELAERAGVLGGLAKVERAWALFGGRREDVSPASLVELRKKAGIVSLDAHAPAQLAAAIGDRWQRTARMHYMPEGARDLPAIATLLGARVVADTAAMKPLVHDELPGRAMLHAADVGYALGHDRAKAYLADDRARFPALDAQLDKARAIVRAPPSPAATRDLYGAWLGAVASVATTPRGEVPSFMDTTAYQDFHLNTALVGYGQMRHNYVLLAGQAYDAYGCEIPDGWVEPALAMYDGLLAYAERGAAAMRELDPADRTENGAYFVRLGAVLKVLRKIAADELEGRALTAAERRWLAMVAEYIPVGGYGDSHAPPRYTGWYFDLFPHREHDAKLAGDFIADYYTSTNAGQVAYIGAAAPRLGVFVVDANGAPRAMVGPVAHGYERTGPLATRLDDAAARALPIPVSPWETSYTAPALPEPPLALDLDEKGTAVTVTARSTASPTLGPITIELLDHHGAAFARQTQNVGAAATFRFTLDAAHRPGRGFTGASAVEGLHVQVGDFHHVAGASAYRGLASFGLGAMRPPREAEEP